MSDRRFQIHRGPDPDTGRAPITRELMARYGLGGSMRMPHHTVSRRALVGHFHERAPEVLAREPELAQFLYQPGEITLARCGVLVLADFSEFHRESIDAIGEAWRAQRVTLPLGLGRVDIDAPFDVLAIAEWCPCGHPDRDACRCTVGQKRRWEARTAGLVELLTLKPSARKAGVE